MEKLEQIAEFLNKFISISLEPLNTSTLIIRTIGEYNMDTSAIVTKALHYILRLNYSRIILDFTKVTYVSSTGVGFVLETHKRLKNIGGMLVVFGMISSVYSVFQLLGFSQILNIVASEKDAINLLH